MPFSAGSTGTRRPGEVSARPAQPNGGGAAGQVPSRSPRCPSAAPGTRRGAGGSPCGRAAGRGAGAPPSPARPPPPPGEGRRPLPAWAEAAGSAEGRERGVTWGQVPPSLAGAAGMAPGGPGPGGCARARHPAGGPGSAVRPGRGLATARARGAQSGGPGPATESRPRAGASAPRSAGAPPLPPAAASPRELAWSPLAGQRRLLPLFPILLPSFSLPFGAERRGRQPEPLLCRPAPRLAASPPAHRRSPGPARGTGGAASSLGTPPPPPLS